MEYIPGQLHEKLQIRQTFEMLNDFVICICEDKRYSEINIFDESEFTIYELKRGDIIILRFFKPSIYSSELYSYIESIITDEKDIKMNKESLLSSDFIESNTENNVLFKVATIDYYRDKKINQIIN